MSRFTRVFFRNRRFDDISVSIQEHIDERINELMEVGVSRDEAGRAARREFGNVTLFRERSREVGNSFLVRSAPCSRLTT